MFNKNKNNNVSYDDVSNMIEPIVARIDTVSYTHLTLPTTPYV